MAAASRLSLAYGGCSSSGGKPVNEDAYALLQPDDSRRESRGVVAVVADGASCSEEARLASQTAVLTFIQDYMSTPDSWDVKTSASRVLSALNAWLYRDEVLPGARHDTLVTTFSAVICKSTTLHLLHCGDSRVWRLRAGKLQQLSTDHSIVLPEGRTALSRALGLDSHAKVDYQSRTLQEQDLLMLTTDGVHGVLDAGQLAAFIQPLAQDVTDTPEGSNLRLEAAAKALVEAALAAGSEDNLTCLLLQVRQLPQQDLDEVHRELTRRVIPPVLEPGQRIDGYTVERVLHSSVRSHLYVVSHPRLRFTCVLKTPSPNIAEDPEGLEAFLREQWVARRIDHPNVMRVLDTAVDSRFLYHVCEHIPGSTLRQWMRDHPQPDLATVRDLVRQIALALRAMQRQGMLHRDLKPENIMVTPAGLVKLIDFGAVRVSGLADDAVRSRDPTPVGTLDYMAPEYLRGEGGEGRADIYSLGVITYELLSGRLPCEVTLCVGGTPPPADAWLYHSLLEVRPDLPLWVDLCLARACEFRPSRRYGLLSEFLHDLEVPNAGLLSAHQQRPLIESHPLRFWQGLSALLLFLLILQTLVHALHS